MLECTEKSLIVMKPPNGYEQVTADSKNLQIPELEDETAYHVFSY